MALLFFSFFFFASSLFLEEEEFKKREREKDSALRDRDKERTNVHGEEGNGTRQEKRAGR